jgi:archaellum biogenesis ATPase FlaH
MHDSDSVETFDYGSTFQLKLIVNLVRDQNFLEQIADILLPEYFEEDKYVWMIRYILKYFTQYGKCATYESVVVQIKKIENDTLRKELIKLAYIIFDDNVETYLRDYETIQHDSIEFCRRQKFKNAFQEAIEYLRKNDFDKVKSLIDTAYDAGIVKDLGMDLDDLEDRELNTPRKDIIPLWSEELNRRIGGGLGVGDFCAIIAPMGAGKSMIGANLIAHTKKLNRNAVLYNLEMDNGYLRQRVDSILLDRPTDELHDVKGYLSQIKDELAKYPSGKVFLKRYVANQITALTLKSHIRLLKSRGIKPDLIVIDYLDIMEAVDPVHRGKKDWEKFEVISRDVAIVAVEEETRIIGLVQGNTDSMDKSVITAKNTSGGAKRLHPCHVIWGYARNDEAKANDEATISFIKNRYGKDGFALPVKTDYSRCKIEVIGNEIYNMNEHGKQTPDEIKSKWKERYSSTRKKHNFGNDSTDKNDSDFEEIQFI